ncbi:5353_t:CDS:2, partial [Gigaspora margarita]
MGKEPHKFCPYFILKQQNANKSNKIAVCKSCIQIFGEKCQQFKNQYTQEEQEAIFSLEVAKDHKSIQQNFINKESDEESSLPSIHSSISYSSTSGPSTSYISVSNLPIFHSFISGLSTPYLSAKTTKQSSLNDTTLAMAQLRNDIVRKRKIKQSESHQRKAKRKHIAEPINQESSSGQDTDTDNTRITKETNNLDQELDNDNNIIENETQWENFVTNWIELSNQENCFDNNDDIYIDNNHS